MKKPLLSLSLLISLVSWSVVAQKSQVTPLFSDDKPMSVEIAFSIRDLKRQTSDTVFSNTVMKYQREDGSWDSLKVDIRARGKFRRANCFFPPIRVRMKKKDTEGTLFAGNKSLKLVVPCQTGKSASDLVIKEFLAYKFYEQITPIHFKTRLLNLKLIDQSARQARTYEVKAFFLEDDDLVAKRFDAKIIEDPNFHPLRLKDTAAVVTDFFQYMISNTDWSSMAQHNIKIMQRRNTMEFYPIPYDFDMSGLVNAPYAQVSELVNASSVRERVYRGFCRPEPVFQYVKNEYLSKENDILNQISVWQSEINAKEIQGIQKYIGEFFAVLKNDRSFRDNIYGKCRTK